MSNELFLDIFDYLDGCDVYDAFSRLNTRFQHLLTSGLLLKINLCSKYESILRNCCWRIILPNRYQIVSLRLSNNPTFDIFFKFCTIDSTFSRLESLMLEGNDPEKIMLILINLASLPRLFSLEISFCTNSADPIEFYALVFKLPVLKYCKISSTTNGTRVSLPLAIPNEFTNVKYLVIDHRCTLNELMSILSYTPQLRRFSCQNLYRTYSNVKKLAPIKLPNLRYIVLVKCDLTFDEFEMFIRTILSPVELLWISTSNDPADLNAARWEKLISEHISHLRKFYY